jgi:hypothetical protein
MSCVCGHGAGSNLKATLKPRGSPGLSVVLTTLPLLCARKGRLSGGGGLVSDWHRPTRGSARVRYMSASITRFNHN